MSSTKDMLAAVIHVPGEPSVFKLERRPIPVPKANEVLVRVHACGLNRSELFTRQGHSPNVQFPRILGIEATGVVASCPSGEFTEGDVVATAMGGLGRVIDGGYAEYTCPPAANVVKIGNTHGLGWEVLGAIPEMLQTAYGSLVRALQVNRQDRLLVRGGTTSVGLAAAAIAKHKFGIEVIGTTRRAEKKDLLLSSGCDNVVIDNGSVRSSVQAIWPKGPTKVLELIGATTLLDSLSCCTDVDGSIVCMTGMVGNQWKIPDFEVMGSIPTAVLLTTYQGDQEDFKRTPLEEMVGQVAKGELKVTVGKIFPLEKVVEAHEAMDSNKAGGKIVLVM